MKVGEVFQMFFKNSKSAVPPPQKNSHWKERFQEDHKEGPVLRILHFVAGPTFTSISCSFLFQNDLFTAFTFRMTALLGEITNAMPRF